MPRESILYSLLISCFAQNLISGHHLSPPLFVRLADVGWLDSCLPPFFTLILQCSSLMRYRPILPCPPESRTSSSSLSGQGCHTPRTGLRAQQAICSTSTLSSTPPPSKSKPFLSRSLGALQATALFWKRKCENEQGYRSIQERYGILIKTFQT